MRRHKMSDNNNVENDNDSDYVYLKRPYLFNIRYNSRQVWNKLFLFMVMLLYMIYVFTEFNIFSLIV